jgi:hypothetical protein
LDELLGVAHGLLNTPLLSMGSVCRPPSTLC